MAVPEAAQTIAAAPTFCVSVAPITSGRQNTDPIRHFADAASAVPSGARGTTRVSKPSRSKIPLILVMAGGVCFALGRRMLGLILTGVGGLLFALRGSGASEPE